MLEQLHITKEFGKQLKNAVKFIRQNISESVIDGLKEHCTLGRIAVIAGCVGLKVFSVLRNDPIASAVLGFTWTVSGIATSWLWPEMVAAALAFRAGVGAQAEVNADSRAPSPAEVSPSQPAKVNSAPVVAQPSSAQAVAVSAPQPAAAAPALLPAQVASVKAPDVHAGSPKFSLC